MVIAVGNVVVVVQQRHFRYRVAAGELSQMRALINVTRISGSAQHISKQLYIFLSVNVIIDALHTHTHTLGAVFNDSSRVGSRSNQSSKLTIFCFLSITFNHLK